VCCPQLRGPAPSNWGPQTATAKVLGDLGVGSVVVHVKGRLNATLAVPTVVAARAEALAEGLRVEKLVHKVQ